MLLMEKSFVAWILHYLSELRQAANNPQTTKKSVNQNTEGKHRQLEGKYSFESTDPRESEIRAHLHP